MREMAPAGWKPDCVGWALGCKGRTLDFVGRALDCVGLVPVLVPVVGLLLVVVVPPEETGVDWFPLAWPPFEVDMSEGEARFETGGPGNT